MESKVAVWKVLCGTIALSVSACLPAFAQEPIIIVDIKAVVDQVARNIGADESLLPLTVQAPIHVAAKVCSVPATVLGMQGSSSGAVGCAATITSPELENVVQARLRKEARTQ